MLAPAWYPLVPACYPLGTSGATRIARWDSVFVHGRHGRCFLHDRTIVTRTAVDETSQTLDPWRPGRTRPRPMIDDELHCTVCTPSAYPPHPQTPIPLFARHGQPVKLLELLKGCRNWLVLKRMVSTEHISLVLRASANGLAVLPMVTLAWEAVDSSCSSIYRTQSLLDIFNIYRTPRHRCNVFHWM